jgi:hypothetical protein
MYTYILVLNHVLPPPLQDNFFPDPADPGIPYRTRNNTNTFLAYARVVFVVLLPPAMRTSKSSGVR